ncbi:DNA oxidative demethylase AlkB [Dokdonella sp.]|uniref:DNA oxidative demethylase AlkB n=1 Tax=Dokdonella sp. TaxID=2291710 RepID=UPI003C3A5F55
MDLFEQDALETEVRKQPLAEGAAVLRNLARGRTPDLLVAIEAALEQAPLRNMTTPGGAMMSVAMSNCGSLGWVSDRRGYRYEPRDPLTQRAWPPMPAVFSVLAAEAAAMIDVPDFIPDGCLINRYQPGARMALHQDRDEGDLGAPIVSVSLGLPAVFLFGGCLRADKPVAVPVRHGDVIVWGGASRLRFHGVRPIKSGIHPLTGPCRFNLTLRKAGPWPPSGL